MSQQTIAILLICAGALWGIFEIFRKFPKSQPEPPKEDQPPVYDTSDDGIINETPGAWFFINLLNQVQLAEDEKTKRHLIDAGKSYLDGFISEPTNGGNSPTN